jgi:hypothetical protein
MAEPASLPDTEDPEPALRCDCCGTERRPEDAILCAICGEPVLGDGWTP